MIDVYLPRTTTEYVYIPDVHAFLDGSDPTSLPVAVAFLAREANPVDGDWITAGWTPGASTPTVRIKVGPAGTAHPAPGLWLLWLRVTGSAEVPTRAVGTVKIT